LFDASLITQYRISCSVHRSSAIKELEQIRQMAARLFRGLHNLTYVTRFAALDHHHHITNRDSISIDTDSSLPYNHRICLIVFKALKFKKTKEPYHQPLITLAATLSEFGKDHPFQKSSRLQPVHGTLYNYQVNKLINRIDWFVCEHDWVDPIQSAATRCRRLKCSIVYWICVLLIDFCFFSADHFMEEVIKEFTALHDEKKHDAAYKLICDAIQNRGMNDPELHWRHAMACRDMAMTAGKTDKALYKKFVSEGLEAAETGLKQDPENPKCHCWSAIHLNYTAQLEGINKRIENSFKMKDHWLKAIHANPDDSVTLHALGRWCFEVTDLPWIKRKFAQAFFSTPPTSTYEEGLKYLLASEK
ncbi:regulator of microtubule dynamics protein 1, partial [Clonorchis sinensis]